MEWASCWVAHQGVHLLSKTAYTEGLTLPQYCVFIELFPKFIETGENLHLEIGGCLLGNALFGHFQHFWVLQTSQNVGIKVVRTSMLGYQAAGSLEKKRNGVADYFVMVAAGYAFPCFKHERYEPQSPSH